MEETKTVQVTFDIKDRSDTGKNLVAHELIFPNAYNCNVMPDLEYQALKQDMSLMDGPMGLGPILCRALGGSKKFEIIDGYYRWKAAGELEWKEMVVEFVPAASINEPEALMMNYRMNKQRGHHDPMKEAKFFNYLIEEQGLKQKQISEMLNLERSSISKKISMLRLDPERLNKYVEREVFSDTPPSVLEIVAQGPTDSDQDELFLEYHEEECNVRDLEDSLRTRKAEADKVAKFISERDKSAKIKNCPTCGGLASGKQSWNDDYVCEHGHSWDPTGKKEEAWENVLKAAKVPKCPVCGEFATQADSDAEEPDDGESFGCMNDHYWDPVKGLDEEEITEAKECDEAMGKNDDGDGDDNDLTTYERQALTPATGKVRRSFPSPHKKADVLAAARKAIKKMILKAVDHATKIEVGSGYHLSEDDQEDISVIMNSSYGMQLAITSDQGRLSFTSIEKTYKSGDNVAKVDISYPYPTTEDGPKAGAELFEKLMSGTLTFNGKKKRGRPKKE